MAKIEGKSMAKIEGRIFIGHGRSDSMAALLGADVRETPASGLRRSLLEPVIPIGIDVLTFRQKKTII